MDSGVTQGPLHKPSSPALIFLTTYDSNGANGLCPLYSHLGSYLRNYQRKGHLFLWKKKKMPY